MHRGLLLGVGIVVAVVIALVAVQLLIGPTAPVPTLGPTASPVATSPVPAATVAAASATASARSAGLPDAHRTPGAINPAVTQGNIGVTICQSGWSAKQRPPTAYTNALKLVQIVQYGYADKSPSDYEEDHLVPLELGGAPRDPKNLWPEPHSVTLSDGTQVGSTQKDGLENAFHADVCTGAMPLLDAQRAFATDWIAAWAAAGRP